MMERVKVIIKNNQKSVKIPSGIRLLLRRCCNAVLIMEGFGEAAEVSITFVNEDQIHLLNKEHRNVDSPTDVLSFPLGENGVYDENPDNGAKMLGDIVLNLSRVVDQAEEYGHSFRREIAYLTAHSMLHLLGYDHVNGGIEAVRMREKEEEVMTQLGLPRNNTYTMNT
jgi:probable rRNA maturation factor